MRFVDSGNTLVGIMNDSLVSWGNECHTKWHTLESTMVLVTQNRTIKCLFFVDTNL